MIQFSNSGAQSMATATFGGGCFWCLEAVFEQIKGVSSVVSGYSAGQHPKPTYELVCSGKTGHAEVIQVEFDPNIVSYAKLLDVFFAIHDPTTLNRQGADSGTQYRSIILFHDEGQKKEAESKIAENNASGVWFKPLVTQVEPLTVFFPAEDYHQHYFANNPQQGYCQAVVAPKVAKLHKHFPEIAI